MRAKHRRAGSLDVRLWQSSLASTHPASSYSSYSGYSETWLDRFLALPASRWFCTIPDEFLLNDNYMTGLSELVPRYELALSILRGLEDDVSAGDEELANSLVSLFFLIHQRYIVTEPGLRAMYQKFQSGIFGHCPRRACAGQRVVAAGANDRPGHSFCCVFCPLCNEIYYVRDALMRDVDGSAFGTTFGPLFFRRFPGLSPLGPPQRPEMRCMGFKIHESKLRKLQE